MCCRGLFPVVRDLVLGFIILSFDSALGLGRGFFKVEGAAFI
jgi:hypothetical protein